LGKHVTGPISSRSTEMLRLPWGVRAANELETTREHRHEGLLPAFAFNVLDLLSHPGQRPVTFGNAWDYVREQHLLQPDDAAALATFTEVWDELQRLADGLPMAGDTPLQLSWDSAAARRLAVVEASIDRIGHDATDEICEAVVLQLVSWTPERFWPHLTMDDAYRALQRLVGSDPTSRWRARLQAAIIRLRTL
jgi:hypothetical protein